MHEAAASCKDSARAPVTNWETHGVTLAGYCYAVRHGMKVQLVTPYRVSHLQRYGVTVPGNVTSVYSQRRLDGFHGRSGHDNGKNKLLFPYRMDSCSWKMTVVYILVDLLTCETCCECINPTTGPAFDHVSY